MSDTTTRFKGDIQFKIGDATRKGSQLLTLGDLDNYVQTGHLFNEVEGLPEVDIKNKNIQYVSFESSTTTYNILKFVNLPEDFMNKLNEIKTQTNIFKIVLRKNIVYDTSGNLVKEFYIYVKDGQVYSPLITKSSNGCSINNSTIMGYMNIAFDSKLDFNPYTLWLNGELSIMNEYITDSLQTEKAIKCSIIKADNALSLRKSDVLYLYKPTSTSQVVIDNKKYWLLQWNIDTGYTIPNDLEFRFNEYCFGNKWFLSWDGTKWVGDNIQGHINGRLVNGLNKENEYGEDGTYIQVKRSERNMKLINKPNDYSPDNILHYMIHGGKCKIDCFVKLKTGEIEPFSKYGLGYQTSQGGTKDGYDIEAIRCYKMNNATNKLETSAIDELYLDITLEGSKNANRFSVRPTGKEGNGGDKVWLFLHGVLDSCEKLEYTYAASTTNDSRDIKIYLADEYVDPIDEVHWDSTTNPFEYIIKQQFYEVSPNPNGATTLYTDYNITSSKIITADNITTMRSDLNLVTNNVDVISYDVNEMNTVMESLKGRVSRTEQVTQHLEDDVDNLRIVSWTALAFGVAGTAGSIGSIGMQLFPDGISFPTIKGGGFLKRLFSHKSTKGMSDLVRNSINFMSGTTARSITKDITPIITWCEEEYKQLDELPFTDENDNPDTGTLTLSGAMDISNMFRDSLKPCFKLLAEKVNELEAEFDNYPTVDEANEGLDVLIRRIETLEGENIALKDTIAAMEARLTALEEKNDPDREWKAYYTGFTDVTDEYNRYFLFSYFTSEKHIIIDNLDNDPTGDNEPVPDGEYLLIFKDKTQKLHFIRFISTEWSDPQQIKSYLDEIYFKDTNPPSGAYDIYNIELDCDTCSMICFDAIYMKK